MHVLRESLKKLPPIHRVGFVFSGLFCFSVGFLGLVFSLTPDIDTNEIANIIINFLYCSPSIGDVPNDYVI